jgi:hypothetical protein
MSAVIREMSTMPCKMYLSGSGKKLNKCIEDAEN